MRLASRFVKPVTRTDLKRDVVLGFAVARDRSGRHRTGPRLEGLIADSWVNSPKLNSSERVSILAEKLVQNDALGRKPGHRNRKHQD